MATAACAHCGGRCRVGDDLAYGLVRCPSCGRTFRAIPSEAPEVAEPPARPLDTSAAKEAALAHSRAITMRLFWANHLLFGVVPWVIYVGAGFTMTGDSAGGAGLAYALAIFPVQCILLVAGPFVMIVHAKRMGVGPWWRHGGMLYIASAAVSVALLAAFHWGVEPLA